MFGKAKIIVVFLSALFVAYGLVGGMLNEVSARDDTYQDLSVFMDVLTKVREDYVEEPDMEKAIQGALHGMMEALDPYSSFIDSQTYSEMEKSREGLSASPGIVLSKRYGYAYIVSVIPGSPAEQEGIRAGDLLESIDGRVTTQMSLWEARQLLRGEARTTVSVRLIRARRTAPSQIELVRGEISPAEISARVVEDGVGVLVIPHLQEGAAKTILARLKMLQSLGVKGLLIDIRGSSIGSVDEAVQVSDFFLSQEKKILSIKGRSKGETGFFSLTSPVVSDIPIVLLVDGGTSGPAEVFVAALRDNEVAETVGEKTNGQGSEQELFPLGDGSVLQISSKLFYRASGNALQSRSQRDSGISPDLRSPGQDFVTNFYFENTSGDTTSPPGEDFYRKLADAIRSEQFGEALERLRRQLLKTAA